MLRSVAPLSFGRVRSAALAVVVTTLASTAPAPSQPLPAGVEKAIFRADQFAQPIALSVPYVTERKQLDAFRNARPNSLGMSPIAPPGHVERSDNRIRLYCALHWIVLESITTREGVKFDYALASTEFKKLGQQRSVPIAERKLKTIDYRNRYKANPMGMGERDVFAVTFSYTIESTVAALHSPSTVFKGKATAQQDPEDGEWKLEKLTLSDEGEQELYKLLSAQPAVACDTSIGAQDPSKGMEQRAGEPAQGTASTGVAFIIDGDEVPVFGSDKVSTVIGQLAAGTPAANAKGTFLEDSWRFALEEMNGRTHIIYLKGGRKKIGWVDSGQLRRFAYDCSCGEMCDPFVTAEPQGSAWNVCFERARSSFVSQSATSGGMEPSATGQGKGTAPAKVSLLGYITDPEIAAGLTRQIRKASGDLHPIVVVSLEGDKAWINLKGTNVPLPIAAREGNPDNVRTGNKFSRKFTREDVSLLIRYEVLSSSVNQEMGCRRTEYRVNIEVSRGGVKEHIEPEDYGEGC